MFAAANGARTLLELARELRLSEFEATGAVHRLLTAGCAQVSGGPPRRLGGGRGRPGRGARARP